MHAHIYAEDDHGWQELRPDGADDVAQVAYEPYDDEGDLKVYAELAAEVA
jgi:hypothetical protein